MPPTRRNAPTVVPTPATRAVASRAREHAKKGSPYDAALRWLPEVQPDQFVAFVGLLLAPAEKPLAVRAVIPRPGACRDCGTSLLPAQSSRGLCKRCYDHHRYAGTLDQFPRVLPAQEAS